MIAEAPDLFRCYREAVLWDRNSVPKHQRHRLRKTVFKRFDYEMVRYAVEIVQIYEMYKMPPMPPFAMPRETYGAIVQWFNDMLGYMPDYNRANASMYFRSVEDMCTTILRFRG